MTGEILLKGGTVLRCEPGFTIESADLLISKGRIAAIGPNLPAAGAEVVDCRDAVILPGFVQTHIHLCQTLLRNQADDLELLRWLQARVWPFEATLSAEDLHLSARLGAAELLEGGTTTILDMGTTHHQDAVFEAIEEAHIRAWSGLCLMDQGDGAPKGLVQRADQAMAESERLLARWHGAADGRIHYAYCPRFALSCSTPMMSDVVTMARQHSAVIHTHAAESLAEVALVKSLSGGRTNIEMLADLGICGPQAVLAHCVHLEASDIDRMARERTRAVHCPSSNLKLASGIARVPETRSRGVHWSLGADGAPCNNRLDAFTEMRLAALIHKPRCGPTAMPAEEVLTMATWNGAEALGAEAEIGSLQPGKRADVQVVDLRGAHLQPIRRETIPSALVYAARASDVARVYVDGVAVVIDGRCVSVDTEALRCESMTRATDIAGRLP